MSAWLTGAGTGRDITVRMQQKAAQRILAHVAAPTGVVQARIGRIRSAVTRMTEMIDRTLSNAVKYSGRARRIDVQLTEPDASVVVSGRDQGVGIAGEDVPRLFTRFFRAGSAAGIPGTG